MIQVNNKQVFRSRYFFSDKGHLLQEDEPTWTVKTCRQHWVDAQSSVVWIACFRFPWLHIFKRTITNIVLYNWHMVPNLDEYTQNHRRVRSLIVSTFKTKGKYTSYDRCTMFRKCIIHILYFTCVFILTIPIIRMKSFNPQSLIFEYDLLWTVSVKLSYCKCVFLVARPFIPINLFHDLGLWIWPYWGISVSQTHLVFCCFYFTNSCISPWPSNEIFVDISVQCQITWLCKPRTMPHSNIF